MSAAKETKKPKGRGGAREGAGRPPLEGGTKPITIRMSGEDLRLLEAACGEGESLNTTAKRLLIELLRGEKH